MQNKFGIDNINTLLLKQALPASVGILAMSLNMIIDTIFVGKWIGVLAIAALTIVLPIAFFMSSVGLGIGIGGSSIISRALGKKNYSQISTTFIHQIALTLFVSIVFLTVGYLCTIPLLQLFGAKGPIIEPSITYFKEIIWGIPFLTFAMMGNPILRAIGKPNFAMFTLILSAFINIALDIAFIKYLDLGMYGAGLATTISYVVSAIFVLFCFWKHKKQLFPKLKSIVFRSKVFREIISLGGITIIRQGAISILIIVLNYSLFKYGCAISISIYGIINRIMMFALFPVLGVTQGFLPIAGYNYGANDPKRVLESIKKSILFGTGIATVIFIIVLTFSAELVQIFTDDTKIIDLTSKALIICFIATPLITTQLIGSAYFQAIGKALPALLLALLKQGFFLLPLVFILPKYFGVDGIWISFPIADILSTVITFIVLRKELKFHLSS